MYSKLLIIIVTIYVQILNTNAGFVGSRFNNKLLKPTNTLRLIIAIIFGTNI